MNESQYAKFVMKRIGKIGDSGQKILDTGWLDSAFGGEKARRELMLNQIGTARDTRNRQLELDQQRLNQADKYNTAMMGLRNKDLERSSSDAILGDTITAASIPISYMAGKKQAKDIDSVLESTKKINEQYQKMLGGYTWP